LFVTTLIEKAISILIKHYTTVQQQRVFLRFHLKGLRESSIKTNFGNGLAIMNVT
jgi:hypothetical protein